MLEWFLSVAAGALLLAPLVVVAVSRARYVRHHRHFVALVRAYSPGPSDVGR